MAAIGQGMSGWDQFDRSVEITLVERRISRDCRALGCARHRTLGLRAPSLGEDGRETPQDRARKLGLPSWQFLAITLFWLIKGK